MVIMYSLQQFVTGTSFSVNSKGNGTPSFFMAAQKRLPGCQNNKGMMVVLSVHCSLLKAFVNRTVHLN